MKKFVVLICLGVMLSGNAWAGDITANGMYQGDVYTYLNNVKTLTNEIKSDFNSTLGNYTGSANLTNEIKTDYNTLFSNYTSAVKTINEVKSDYNVLFANYTGLIKLFNNFTSFAEQKAYSFSKGSTTSVSQVDARSTSTAVTSSNATVGSGNTVSTSDLSLTGL